MRLDSPFGNNRLKGQGSSFAGVAAGTNGLSSMFWNPATITQHNEQGYSSESNFSLIAPTSRADDGAGFPGNSNSGNISDWGLAPASYNVYGLTDDITVGLAMGAPFGLSTNSDLWAGSLHGDESSVVTFNANPNIAYKFNDMLSVAVGVQAEYMKVKTHIRHAVSARRRGYSSGHAGVPGERRRYRLWLYCGHPFRTQRYDVDWPWVPLVNQSFAAR